MNIIDNPKVLKRLNNEGLIEWPITRHGVKPNGKPFSYVDEVEKVGMSFQCSKGNKYRLQYLSGCFFPYVTQTPIK